MFGFRGKGLGLLCREQVFTEGCYLNVGESVCKRLELGPRTTTSPLTCGLQRECIRIEREVW